MTWNSWAVNRFWVCGDASSPHHESQMSEETVSPQKQEKKKRKETVSIVERGKQTKVQSDQEGKPWLWFRDYG